MKYLKESDAFGERGLNWRGWEMETIDRDVVRS